MYRHTVVCIGGIEELIPLVIGVSGSIGGRKMLFKEKILPTSANADVSHDASVQRDHSEMIVHVTMQIFSVRRFILTFWMQLPSKDLITIRYKVHLQYVALRI